MSINSLAPPRAARQNPLKALHAHGQSVWLDYIRRSLITSGELQRLVDEDGLRGVTSNPTIFATAIASSDDYSIAIAELARHGHTDPKTIFEELAILDIQAAANILRPVYQHSNYRDGYASLEVSPRLAHDTAETIEDARRLWMRLSRPNAMIKVPATEAGIEAIRVLTSEGINVNATLLFSAEVYERVADAYMSGLEERNRRGSDLRRVASVASVFVSRIDTAIDALIATRLDAATTLDERAALGSFRGRIAIANARLTYQRYRRLCASPRWKHLSALGAQTQRLLWASTSTKNPAYRDVVYVEELVGSDTVNTIPPATFAAFRHHGEVRPALVEQREAAALTMRALEGAGISMPQVTARLLDEGVQAFVEAFDTVLAAIEVGCRDAMASR